MNLQEELKVLKQRIAELEELAKEEREFPQDGDTYWYIGKIETGCWGVWEDSSVDKHLKSIGNVFETEGEAEFAVEKLKVESELRKFSRPFKYNVSNYYVELCLPDNSISVFGSGLFQTQGAVYFESKEKAQQAIETAGEERIKKYIFGVED